MASLVVFILKCLIQGSGKTLFPQNPQETPKQQASIQVVAIMDYSRYDDFKDKDHNEDFPLTETRQTRFKDIILERMIDDDQHRDRIGKRRRSRQQRFSFFYHVFDASTAYTKRSLTKHRARSLKLIGT